MRQQYNHRENVKNKGKATFVLPYIFPTIADIDTMRGWRGDAAACEFETWHS